MPITVYSDDEITAQATAYLRTRFNKDISPDSFLGKLARAMAMLVIGIEKAVKDADNDATPSKSSSKAALDQWAVVLGVSDGSGVEGSYGRKKATGAAGGQATLTGTNGTVYPAGLKLTASDGTILKLANTLTIISGGSVAGAIITALTDPGDPR